MKPTATCRCGRRWRYAGTEPSPVTEEGCPECDEATRIEYEQRSVALLGDAAVAFLRRRPLSSPHTAASR